MDGYAHNSITCGNYCMYLLFQHITCWISTYLKIIKSIWNTINKLTLWCRIIQNQATFSCTQQNSSGAWITILRHSTSSVLPKTFLFSWFCSIQPFDVSAITLRYISCWEVQFRPRKNSVCTGQLVTRGLDSTTFQNRTLFLRVFIRR